MEFCVIKCYIDKNKERKLGFKTSSHAFQKPNLMARIALNVTAMLKGLKVKFKCF